MGRYIEELKETVSVLAKRANTRLRNLEKAELENESYSYLLIFRAMVRKLEYMDATKDGLVKFKTKMKNRSIDQLREELKRLYEFLNEEDTKVSYVRKEDKSDYDTYVLEKFMVDISEELYIAERSGE